MMKVLPITNTDYVQKINFGGVHKIASKFVQSGLSDLGQTVKTLSGAVIVLAALNKKQKAENAEADFQIKELTDEEFETKKNEILAKKKKFEPFKYLRKDMFTKWNVQLFDYMYEDCKGLTSKNPTDKDLEKLNNFELYNSFMQLQCSHHCVPVKNKEQAEVILKMMKMPWFFASDGDGDYDYALNNAGCHIEGENIAKIKDVKLKMLDELEKNREKYKEATSDQKNNIIDMITSVNTENGLNIALKMINNPHLLDTDSCYVNSNRFFKEISQNEERAKIASEVIDKILSKPELFEKEYFKESIVTILSGTTNNYKKDFVFKLLETPELFDKDYFVGNLPGIIRFFPKGESAKAIETRKGIYQRLEDLISDIEYDSFDDVVDCLTDYYCELHWSIERDFPDPGEQEEWERKCKELWD